MDPATHHEAAPPSAVSGFRCLTSGRRRETVAGHAGRRVYSDRRPRASGLSGAAGDEVLQLGLSRVRPGGRNATVSLWLDCKTLKLEKYRSFCAKNYQLRCVKVAIRRGKTTEAEKSSAFNAPYRDDCGPRPRGGVYRFERPFPVAGDRVA